MRQVGAREDNGTVELKSVVKGEVTEVISGVGREGRSRLLGREGKGSKGKRTE